MSIEKQHIDRDGIRKRAAAEVIELGEVLFDTAIDVAARQPAGGEELDALLIEEMRTAANEFFIALRLLLQAGQGSPIDTAD